MKNIKKILAPYRQSLITAGVLGVVAVVVLTISAITHHRSQSGQDQLKQVTNAVSKLIILPTDETPTLATVSDANKLKNQAIFAKAKDGDRVLIYVKAQKVIIYRPSAHKIVDVNPFIADKKGSPYVTSKVAILNGSGNDDLLAKMTQSVLSAFPNATIVVKDVAPRLFPNSLAIDLTKKNQPLDEQVADSLGIKAGQLPLGISSPASADILIIIGQDYSR